MDIGQILENIVPVLILAGVVWTQLGKPLVKELSKRSKAKIRPAGAAEGRAAYERPASRQSSASRASERPSASAFRSESGLPPTPPQPAPLAPGSGNSIFLSGEEGMRVTSPVPQTDSALAPASTAASSILDTSDEQDLVRGMIWAQILSPKFKE